MFREGPKAEGEEDLFVFNDTIEGPKAEGEEDLFVFNDTIEGPKAPSVQAVQGGTIASSFMEVAKKKGCSEGIVKCFGNVIIGVGVFVGTVTCGFISCTLYGRRRTSRSFISSNTRNEERSILASINPSTQAQRDRALQVPKP